MANQLPVGGGVEEPGESNPSDSESTGDWIVDDTAMVLRGRHSLPPNSSLSLSPDGVRSAAQGVVAIQGAIQRVVLFAQGQESLRIQSLGLVVTRNSIVEAALIATVVTVYTAVRVVAPAVKDAAAYVSASATWRTLRALLDTHITTPLMHLLEEVDRELEQLNSKGDREGSEPETLPPGGASDIDRPEGHSDREDSESEDS